MRTTRKRLGAKGRLWGRRSHTRTVLIKRFPLSTFEELEARKLLAIDSSAFLGPALAGDHIALSVRSLLSSSAMYSVTSTSSSSSSNSATAAATTSTATASANASPNLTSSVTTDNAPPLITPALSDPTVTPDASTILMSYTLEAFALSDTNHTTPITSIASGQQFQLAAFATDVRNPPEPTTAQQGVFAGYVDVAYDSTRASISTSATFTYGTFFTNTFSGNVQTAGQIIQAGAAAGSISGPGNAPQLLWTIPVTATAANTTETFTSSFGSPSGFDSLLYTDNSAVPADQITFGTLTMNIGAAGPTVLLNAPNANYTTNWTNAGAVGVANSATSAITDGQSANLSSMTVTLAGPHTGDVLAANTTGTSITAAAYNATTGVLLLSGTDTLAHYLAVLNTVGYNNTSGGPQVSSETVDVVINDGTNVSSTSTATVTVNSPPVVQLNAPNPNFTTTWTNAGAVGIANSTNASITDGQSSTLNSMTVTLSTHQTGDVLSATGTGSVTVTSYNSATGVLLLSGSDTLADYLTVLKSVTYNNTAGGPGLTSESISVLANDGTSSSNTAASTVTINLPPVVKLNAPDTNYSTSWNNTGAVAIASSTNATITDGESANLTSMIVTLASPHTGDLLAATGTGSVTVTAYNATTGVLLLSGTDTLADYLTVLKSVTYNNTVGGPQVPTETINVVANDGTAPSATATSTVSVNLPPIVQLNAPNANYSTSWTNAGAVAIANSANATLTDGASSTLSSLTVTLESPHAGDLLSATATGSVTVTAFNATTGVLLLSGTDTLTDYLTVLKSVTYNNTSGGPLATTETIDVVANDGTQVSGTAVSSVAINVPVVKLNAPSANYATTWTNGGAVAISSSVNAAITDGQSTTLSSLTVTLASPHTGDVLSATTAGTDITLTAYNATTGVLLLSGSDTLADYLTVLKSVTYNNTDGGPQVLTETIDVVANDGTAISGTSVATVNINTPPVVQLNAPNANYSTAWNNTAAVAIASTTNATITDGESSTLSSMTVTLSTHQTGDVLLATGTGNVTVTAYNAATGVLLLTGSDTLADYLTVLRSVTYNNTVGGPLVTTETASVVANDGTQASTAVTTTIDINVPIVQLNGPNPNYTTTWTNGGTVAIASSTNATIIDGESTTLSSLTVTLTSPHAGDVLAAAATGSVTVNPYNATTGVLLLSGTDTLADYLTVLKSVTYDNSQGGPGVPSETIDVVINDGTAVSGTAVSTIDISTPPVVQLNAPNANYTTAWINSGAVGIASSDNAAISDGESSSLASMTVTLTSPQTGDVLAATGTGNVTVTAYNATTGVLLLSGVDTLADYLTVLKSITYNNTAGGPLVTSESVDVVANDGTQQSSTSTATISIDVPIVKLNSPDVNFSTTWTNGGAVAIASSTNASLVDAGSGNLTSMTVTLASPHTGDVLAATATGSVTVTAYNATTGVLLLSGTDTLDDYLTVLKSVTYNNTSGGPQVASEIVTVLANDGTAAGNTATATVGISTAPVVQLNAPNTNFTTTWANSGAIGIASSTNAAITDGESGTLSSMTVTLPGPHTGDVLAATGTGNVTVTAYNATTGVLLLSGVDTLADYLTVLKSVTYNNTSGGPQVSSETIDVVANDGTLSSATAVSTVTINAPPVVQLNAPNTNFSTTWTNGGAVAIASSTNAAITDGESSTLSSLTVTLASPHTGDLLAANGTGNVAVTAYNATTGVLLLSGTDTLADYLTVLKTVTYNNTSGGPQVTSETINVVANDGTATSAAATSTVTVSTPPFVQLNAPNTNFTTSWNDTGAVAIANGTNATITDGESSTLTSLTVTLASPQTGDVLTATGTGNVTVTAYNATTGSLVLSGTDTLANYLTVLKSVTYDNTVGNPNVSTETANVVANDGTATSTTATTTIDINVANSSLAGFVQVNTGHVGLGGVSIALTGTTSVGAAVNLTTTSASDGSYSFDSLSPGTYKITFTQPSKYETGTTVAGSQGGTASGNTISVTIPSAGVDGTGNDFDLPGLTADEISQRLLLASAPTTSPTVTSSAVTADSTIVPTVSAAATSTDTSTTSGGTTTASIRPGLSSSHGSISLNNGTVTVTGTAGNDTFSFTAGASVFTVTLDGTTRTFSTSSVSKIVFNGNGGTDSATLTGSSGDEVASVGLHSGTLTGSSYTVSVNGVSSLALHGGGGHDTATLTDTALNGFLQASGDLVSLSNSSGASTSLSGFAQVTAVASSSGTDTAHVEATDFALSESGNWLAV